MNRVRHDMDARNTTTEMGGETFEVGYVCGWFFTWVHTPAKGWELECGARKHLTRSEIQDIVDTLEEDDLAQENEGDPRPASRGTAERRLRSYLRGR